MNNERKELAGWLVKKVEARSYSLSPWRERVRVRGINTRYELLFTNAKLTGKLVN